MTLSKDGMVQSLHADADAVIDMHTHVGISPDAYITRGYPYCLSMEDLAIRMTTLGISCSVVFPYGSFYYALARKPGPKVRVTGRISRFPYEIENQNLLHEIFEIFPQYSHMCLPFGMFDPSRRQTEQVDHLRTLAAKYPLYGLKTVTSYTQARVSDLLTPRGRCILDLARDLDLPVTIHTSVAPGDPWANVFSILDVVSARPDVRFILAHVCRFSRRALEAADSLDNCFVDLSAFHIHCQLAVRDSEAVASRSERLDADYDKPLDVMRAVARAFPSTICWATDTPAYYFINGWVDETGRSRRTDLRCDWDVEAKALNELDRDLRRVIAHENPLKALFGRKRAPARP
jgi:hypothetical protein